MASTSSSSSSTILLSFLLFITVCFSFCSASKYDHQNNDPHLSFSSRGAKFPKLQAQKLITELNLFPDDDINVAAHAFRNLQPEQKIVEKRFELPVAGNAGPSVKELGHHAGYYRLPHSKAAR